MIQQKERAKKQQKTPWCGQSEHELKRNIKKTENKLNVKRDEVMYVQFYPHQHPTFQRRLA